MKRVLLVVLAFAALFAGTAGVTPAHAATVPGPLGVPSSVVGSLELNASGTQLASWPRAYGGGSCDEAGKATVKATGDTLNLETTGATDSCAVVGSPTTYTYGVFEFRINPAADHRQIANWPAAWLTGGSWDKPSYQELDAFEGNVGVDYASYWTGNGAPADADVTGYSTGPCGGPYACTIIPALSAAIIPNGWSTVDVVWSPTGFSVYYNGKLYAHAPESEATPMNIILDNTEGPNGLQPAGHASDFQVGYVRVWSYRC
jgi:Glycosyl hydrolases family 16